MTPISLVAWAACAFVICMSSPTESATTTATPPASSQIVKQINRVNDDGSYTIGYEAADGTFKIETRDADGNVKGMFGFLDATGQIKKVAYSTSNSTESPQNVEDINTVTEFNPSPSTKRQPSYIRARQRSAPSNLIKYRRPAIPDTENPDDDSPVLAMLLRRSRQGIPSRSDADELLRLQQADNPDVYGSSGGSPYQVPDIPFRQHFLQGGRGRVNNAVLQHHLRQLTPDQLYELQQYASTAGSQAVPDPTYMPRVPVRTTMHPLLSYLSNNNVARDYEQTYPTRYPSTQQYYYPPATQAPYYPPTQASFYPTSSTYAAGYGPAAGYGGVTAARSYPYQNPNLPDELRQALIYRMLVAARLLGLESFIQRYATANTAAAVSEDARALEYDMQMQGRYYPRTTPASFIPDPRYYQRDVTYPTQAYPTPNAYYNTLAVARAAHARQLAAYQQAILAQEQQQRQYGRYGGVQDLSDDPAITELRRQFGDSAVHNGRYNPNPVIYRVGVQQPDTSTSDDEYATVTPSSSPSVSSTTAGSVTSQRTPTERPTPSYIQRVRSVQVLNSASASPRGSSTTASPTTRRSLQAP